MSVYDIITDKIIKSLEGGVIPWHRSWKGAMFPINYQTKKAYRGVNILLLSLAGGTTPYYLTFNQIKNMGGSVKAGAKSQIVIFWNWIEKANEKGEIAEQPFLRYYRVFNLDQTIGLDYENPYEKIDSFSSIQKAEEIVAGYAGGPLIVDSKVQMAAYSSTLDQVQMPLKLSFDSEAQYYAVLFHELVHSTGHKDRLDREGVSRRVSFGNELYSKEELIAEIGSAFLCNHAGIDEKVFTNSVAYIQNWLSALKNDKRLVLNAASQAQRAIDRILGREDVQKNDNTTREETYATAN